MISTVLVDLAGVERTVQRILMNVKVISVLQEQHALTKQMTIAVSVMRTALETCVSLQRSVVQDPVTMEGHVKQVQTILSTHVSVWIHTLANSVKYMIPASPMSVRMGQHVSLMETHIAVNVPMDSMAFDASILTDAFLHLV